MIIGTCELVNLAGRYVSEWSYLVLKCKKLIFLNSQIVHKVHKVHKRGVSFLTRLHLITVKKLDN